MRYENSWPLSDVLSLFSACERRRVREEIESYAFDAESYRGHLAACSCLPLRDFPGLGRRAKRRPLRRSRR